MEAVTVMIPARNVQATVGRAISSVLRALPRDGRVLVVDDASEDDTARIVRDIARDDRRVGLLNDGGPRMGLAKASNALLDAADTSLVARMDADDVTLPWRFRTQMSMLRRHRLDLAFSPAVFFGPQRFSFEPQPLLSAGPESVKLELLLNCAVMQPTVTGHRSALLDAGGYRAVPSEDWDLWMRLAANGARLGRSATPTLLYRRHAAQTSFQHDYQPAVAADTRTAAVHAELCRSVLGDDSRAYAALCASGASDDEVADAERLIDEVTARSSNFSPPERFSIRATAHGIRIRLRRRYPGRTDS